MAQVKRRKRVTRKPAATIDRNFRTFLLVSQLEAAAIGRRIALARKEAGMTQEDVADVATFSKRSLQDYESGVTLPYKHLRELGALLGRPTEWFLHGEPEFDPSQEERLERIEAQLAEIRGMLAGQAQDADQPDAGASGSAN